MKKTPLWNITQFPVLPLEFSKTVQLPLCYPLERRTHVGRLLTIKILPYIAVIKILPYIAVTYYFAALAPQLLQ